jgi:hypothetical protein
MIETEYDIDSIDLHRCRKSPEIIYKILKKCDNCHKLPIPQFRSKKQQRLIFCKSCYFALNHELKNLIFPSILEKNLLEALIFSCKNSSCDKEFNVKSLKEMLEHEENCDTIADIKPKCNICNSFVLVEEHNCLHEQTNQQENKEFDYSKIINVIKTSFKEELKNELGQLNQKILKIEQAVNDKSQKLILSEQKIINLEHLYFICTDEYKIS